MEAINFIAQGCQAWPILLADDHPTARFAAEELQTYLRRISDRLVPIVASMAGNDSPCIELLYKSGRSDGFVREVSPQGIRLVGRSPRGLLFAVYDLLEELGCRWYYPGVQGERIPRLTTVGLPLGIKDEEPFLRGRSLIVGHDQYLQEISLWIDWAGKNRLNGVFFHPFPSRALGGHYEKAWQRTRGGATRELQRRGMLIEYGGHLLAELLPRRLFIRYPRAFRFNGRRRSRDHNLCPSNPDALRIIRQRARRFFLRYPEVDLFHIWSDDVVGGGWCLCPSCRHLSASDQALTVTNAIAEILSEVNPQALVSFLAYHDTSTAPIAIKPRPNVVLLYAPRERCYAHSLDDDACPVNRNKYAPDLISQVAWFQGAAWPEHHVFEYYLDGILFKSMAPPLSSVLPADLRAYHDMGCDHVGMLMTGDCPWITPPLNAFLFAKLAWNPNQDVDSLVRDYALGYYGGPESFFNYQQEMETAFRLLLDLTPQKDVPVMPAGKFLESPPKDVLDFMEIPLEARRVKLAALLEARKHIEAAGTYLEAASRPGAGSKPRGSVTRQEILGREERYFRLVSLQFDFLYQRQLAYCLVAERASRREIKAALRRAESALKGIYAWGKRELAQKSEWLPLFSLMRIFWRLHIWKVNHDILAWTFFDRLAWRWRAVMAVARAIVRVRLS